jgi:uncharacterized protein
MLSVASLHLYPVKSLGGFAVNEAHITDRGFAHDRRWMLVDPQGSFLSQRELPAMACLHCSPREDGFRVTDIRDGHYWDLPWRLDSGEAISARVWDDPVELLRAPTALADRFSEKLGAALSLAFMPDASQRPVDARYAKGITSLSDGFPYLIISQASVDDLNARGRSWAHEHMGTWAEIPMDRFRPNIVIAGGEVYQEDGWKEITIGDVRFALVKPCARCVITTTDQRTGGRGKEPLRTLASYRSVGSHVLFGMNAMAVSKGVMRLGDHVRC